MESKKLLFILMFAFSALTISAQNLALDPSFELLSLVWQMNTAGGRSIVAVGAQNGTYCEQMTLANTFPRAVWQNIAVKPKNLYTCTGWIKTDTVSTNAHIIILWYNAVNPPNNQMPAGYLKADTVGVHRKTNPWTKDSNTFIAPATALSCQLFLECATAASATGAAWFDNFSFYNSNPKGKIFTKDSTTFCQGNGALIVADTLKGYTYKWLLNNKPIPGATTFNYYATTAGQYRVIVTYLTLSDTSKPIAITVNSLPLKNISTTDPTTFCQGKSAVLSADSLYGYTFKWMKNGTVLPGKTRKIIQVTDSGNYSVITQNQFCSDTSNVIKIKINLLPANKISTTDSVTFCQGNKATLLADSFANYTFKWLKNNTIIAGKKIKILVVNSSGNYNTIVSNGTCTDTSNTITIKVNPLPLKNLTTSDPTTFCKGKNALLTTDSLYGYTFRWMKNGIILPGKIRRTLQAIDSGTYSVIVKNEFCMDTTNSIILKVNPLPANKIATTDPVNFCQGQKATLVADSFTGYTFTWLKNTTVIPAENKKFLVVTSPGNYNVLVSNGTCSDTSNTITILVSPLPLRNISATDTAFCKGKSSTLLADWQSSYKYKWLCNGTILTGATSETLNVTTGGKYRAIISNGFCTDTSMEINIIVYPKPTTPVVSKWGKLLYSSSNYGNQWYVGKIPISGATDSSYQPTYNNTYYVIVTSKEGCVSDTSNKVIINSFGISDNFFDAHLKIYPNPGNGHFVLENDLNIPMKTEILNLDGKIIAEFVIPANEVKSFSGEEMNAGVYFLKFYFNENIIQKKLIVY